MYPPINLCGNYFANIMRLLHKPLFCHPELVSGSHNILIFRDSEINSE